MTKYVKPYTSAGLHIIHIDGGSSGRQGTQMFYNRIRNCKFTLELSDSEREKLIIGSTRRPIEEKARNFLSNAAYGSWYTVITGFRPETRMSSYLYFKTEDDRLLFKMCCIS